MNSEVLRIFESVARNESFTKAAKELRTVQSNVTNHIQQLENQLGVTLFFRNSKGVKLSTAGEKLLPYARQIERTLNEATDLLQETQKIPKGKIRIGSMETTAALRLPNVLIGFCEKFPKVEISFTTDTTAALIEAVSSSELDGAFVAGPINQLDLIQLPIIQEELVLVTSKHVKSLKDLAQSTDEGIKILVFREGCAYRKRFEATLADLDISFRHRMELGSLDAILACTAAGMGVTFLPKAVVVAHPLSQKLTTHKVKSEYSNITTLFIRRNNAYFPAAFQQFIEYLRNIPSSIRSASRLQIPSDPRPHRS